MRPLVFAVGTVVSAVITIGINFALVRPLVRWVGHPENKRSATLFSLLAATAVSIPSIRHAKRFARLAEKSTVAA